MKLFLFSKPLYMLLFGLFFLVLIIGFNLAFFALTYNYNIPVILYIILTLGIFSLIWWDFTCNSERLLTTLFNYKISDFLIHKLLLLAIFPVASLIVKILLTNNIYKINTLAFRFGSPNSNLQIHSTIQLIGSSKELKTIIKIETDSSLLSISKTLYDLCFSENPAMVIKNTIDC